jgi:glyoxylase-like metal-dependent hydrolase (beta-lactamase superfamily II)
MKETFDVPIYIHESDEAGLEFDPDYTFKDGDTLPCGLKVINLKDQKSPGESAFLLAEKKRLFVGDALIGKVPGHLNQLPAEKFADIDKAKESLKVLKEYDFEDLLLGDGEPIQGGAKAKLNDFLGA